MMPLLAARLFWPRSSMSIQSILPWTMSIALSWEMGFRWSEIESGMGRSTMLERQSSSSTDPNDLIAITQHQASSALKASLRPFGLKSTDMGATKSAVRAVGHWDKLSQSNSKAPNGLSRPLATLSFSRPSMGSALLLILASAWTQSLRMRASFGIAESMSSASVVKVR